MESFFVAGVKEKDTSGICGLATKTGAPQLSRTVKLPTKANTWVDRSWVTLASKLQVRPSSPDLRTSLRPYTPPWELM